MYRRLVQVLVATTAVVGMSATAAAAAVTYVISDKAAGTGVISPNPSGGYSFQSVKCVLVSDGDIDPTTGLPIKYHCTNNGTITTNSATGVTTVNGSLQSQDGSVSYSVTSTQDASNPALFHLKGKGTEQEPGDPGQPPCTTPVKVSGSTTITAANPDGTYNFKFSLVVKEPSTAC
jgi:hypothetical protein